jgi:proteasome accessory factor B
MGKKIGKKLNADTQPQLTRLHALVKRIQHGDYPNRKILAAEWEKTPRTIQRDLDFIRDVWNLPLEYDSYRYGFYFSGPVANFPMIPISEKELISVFIAQKALMQYHGTPFEQPLRSAFEKLASSLQGEISVAWADLDSAISFRGIETRAEDMEVLATLSGSIRNRNEIEFGYRKLDAESCKLQAPSSRETLSSNQISKPGGEHVRTVRPYHLANIGNQWYLFGYDLLRQDMRKFVPARMSDLKVTKRKFEKPKDFSVDKLLKGSFGVHSGGKPTEMTVWFDRARAQLVREKKWHHSQEIRELGNGELEVTFELSSFVEIVPWILGWGEHARAVDPSELVQEVRRTVSRVEQLYG